MNRWLLAALSSKVKHVLCLSSRLLFFFGPRIFCCFLRQLQLKPYRRQQQQMGTSSAASVERPSSICSPFCLYLLADYRVTLMLLMMMMTTRWQMKPFKPFCLVVYGLVIQPENSNDFHLNFIFLPLHFPPLGNDVEESNFRHQKSLLESFEGSVNWSSFTRLTELLFERWYCSACFVEIFQRRSIIIGRKYFARKTSIFLT